MKNFTFILVCTSFITIGFSQNAFYDAITLTQYVEFSSGSPKFIIPGSKPDSIKTIEDSFAMAKFKEDSIMMVNYCNIINRYYSNKFKTCKALHEGVGRREINDTTKNPDYNPFFGNYLSPGGVKSEVADVKIAEGAEKSALAISSLRGLDVTNIADGLAKFLVERVKQELSTSFFSNFKTELNNNVQLKILFPVTFKALDAIDEEIYNYSAYLDLLRESFQKDLTLILPHIEDLVEDKSMDVVFNKYPEIRLMLSHALFIVNEFGQGKFPGEVFHNYITMKASSDSAKLNSVNPNLLPSLLTLDLFLQSIRSQQAGQYWISADSLKLLFDPVTFQIYMGLIYQQTINKPIVFSDRVSLKSILEKYPAKIDSLIYFYQPFLTGLAENGRNIGFYFNAIKEKQKAGKDKPTYQDYYSLFDASMNFLEYLEKAPFIIKHFEKEKRVNLDNYFASLRSIGNIYVDVYEKQYTSAIVEFTGIFDLLLSNKLSQQIKDNEEDVKNEKDDAKKKMLKDTGSQLQNISKVSFLVLKYGSFAASLAKAETSEDVKNAIEAAALPAGSSRIKRETPFNVSLNAYCGLFMGYEYVKGVDHPLTWNYQKINSYGLTAPIGVSLSTGSRRFLNMPCKKDGHWSYSAFFSLIDIGAVAAFRFHNDTVAQVPTIHLQDIFSPGLFFSVGIPKCPISINIGAQVGPNLRNIYSEEDEQTGEMVLQNKFGNRLYTRYSISAVVDIPILNFYTRSK